MQNPKPVSRLLWWVAAAVLALVAAWAIWLRPAAPEPVGPALRQPELPAPSERVLASALDPAPAASRQAAVRAEEPSEPTSARSEPAAGAPLAITGTLLGRGDVPWGAGARVVAQRPQVPWTQLLDPQREGRDWWETFTDGGGDFAIELPEAALPVALSAFAWDAAGLALASAGEQVSSRGESLTLRLLPLHGAILRVELGGADRHDVARLAEDWRSVRVTSYSVVLGVDGRAPVPLQIPGWGAPTRAGLFAGATGPLSGDEVDAPAPWLALGVFEGPQPSVQRMVQHPFYERGAGSVELPRVSLPLAELVLTLKPLPPGPLDLELSFAAPGPWFALPPETELGELGLFLSGPRWARRLRVRDLSGIAISGLPAGLVRVGYTPNGSQRPGLAPVELDPEQRSQPGRIWVELPMGELAVLRLHPRSARGEAYAGPLAVSIGTADPKGPERTVRFAGPPYVLGPRPAGAYELGFPDARAGGARLRVQLAPGELHELEVPVPD